ncbi:MAG TPA: DUF424 family protein [Candidatus Nanoarchaeia archaeon]|nr:DUF424 family protein [Candidatus Nanoarchaeia archaeon]
MHLKKHHTGTMEILALCDDNVLGKTFQEEGLKLAVSEHFYNGGHVSPEQALEALNNATSANIVGQESINLSLQAGLITNKHLLKIQGIPYTLIFNL